MSVKKKQPSINPEEIYKKLITEGPNVPTDTSDLRSPIDIPWYDPELFRKGVEFSNKHIYSIFLNNMCLVVFNFGIKSLSGLQILSGYFSNEDKAFERVVNTLINMGSWFNFFEVKDTTSEAFKNFQRTRKIHKSFSNLKASPTSNGRYKDTHFSKEIQEAVAAIREDLKHVDVPVSSKHVLVWDPPNVFSQYNMAIMPFAAFALPFLFPELSGIRFETNGDPREDPGLLGFLHCWAVINKMLGVEDRFNLALYPNKELYEQVFNNIFVASLKEIDPNIYWMHDVSMKGLMRLNLPYIFRAKSWIYLNVTEKIPNSTGSNLWATMNTGEIISYYVIKLSYKLVYFSSIFRILFNYTLAIALLIGQKRYSKRK